MANPLLIQIKVLVTGLLIEVSLFHLEVNHRLSYARDSALPYETRKCIGHEVMLLHLALMMYEPVVSETREYLKNLYLLDAEYLNTKGLINAWWLDTRPENLEPALKDSDLVIMEAILPKLKLDDAEAAIPRIIDEIDALAIFQACRQPKQLTKEILNTLGGRA